MKATYRCDYCNFTTDNLDIMKAHENGHKETEKLVANINSMIDEYNATHKDSKFSLAHYKLNDSADPGKPKKFAVNECITSNNKPAAKPCHCRKDNAGLTPLDILAFMFALEADEQ